MIPAAMVQAQPAAPPAYGAPPHQQHGYAQPPPPQGFGQPPMQGGPRPTAHGGGAAKSKKLLLIGGIGAVAVAGIIIAVVMLKGGGDDHGASSPEALAKAGLAALANGDEAAYKQLTADVPSMLDCKYADDASMEEFAGFLKVLVRSHKGAKLTLKSIEPSDEKVKTTLKGKRVMASCKLRADMTSETFKIKLATEDDDKEITMSAMQSGGVWYLNSFDNLPEGPDAEAARKDSDDMFKGMDKKRKARFRKRAGGSPEAVLKTVVEATIAGSDERARAILIDSDELDEDLHCDSEIGDKVSSTRDMVRELGPKDDWDDDSDLKPKQKQIELGAITPSDKGKVAAGETFRGCKPESAVEWVELKVKVKVDGDEDKATAVTVKLDDQWRVLYIDD